jgi:hypothetical protein
MSDNTSNRGEPDRSRISLEQEHEVRYWTETLGCTEEQLREAVAAVGNSADEVRQRVVGGAARSDAP